MAATRQQRKAAEAAILAKNQPSSKKAAKRRSLARKAFKRFPDLPAEIRALVWMFVCFQSRNVDIGIRRRGFVASDSAPAVPSLNGPGKIQLFSYFSQVRPPPALHVNQELRAEALKCYSLDFGREVVERDFTVTFPPKIYINWKVDRLCWMDWGDVVVGDHYSSQEPWRRPFATEFYQVCETKKLRCLTLNAGLETRVLHGILKSLLTKLSFLDDISFMFEPRYAGPPWKNGTLELERYRKRVDQKAILADIDAFLGLLKQFCDEADLEHIPVVGYMALLKKPGWGYALAERSREESFDQDSDSSGGSSLEDY